jgi:hypothetical protein
MQTRWSVGLNPVALPFLDRQEATSRLAIRATHDDDRSLTHGKLANLFRIAYSATGGNAVQSPVVLDHKKTYFF